jgi:hypothetical protein
MKTTIYSDQTILDVAIQTTGTTESLFEILKMNALLSLEMEGINELEVPQPYKTLTVRYFKNNNIKPATGFRESINNPNLMFTTGIKVSNTLNTTLIKA